MELLRRLFLTLLSSIRNLLFHGALLGESTFLIRDDTGLVGHRVVVLGILSTLLILSVLPRWHFSV